TITDEKMIVISLLYKKFHNLISEMEFILCTLRVLQMNCSAKLLGEDLMFLLEKRINQRIIV
ncbi:hypothetical protein, partial [Bacillus cereus]